MSDTLLVTFDDAEMEFFQRLTDAGVLSPEVAKTLLIQGTLNLLFAEDDRKVSFVLFLDEWYQILTDADVVIPWDERGGAIGSAVAKIGRAALAEEVKRNGMDDELDLYDRILATYDTKD